MTTEFAQDLNTFTLQHADDHSIAWFKTHVRLFDVPPSADSSCDPKHMNAYFLTNEGGVTVNKPIASNAETLIPVNFERAPLQFKGFYNTKTQELDAEVGILAKPGVYLKLAPLKGKPNEISAKFDGNPEFYNGDIKITAEHNALGFSLKAAINWIGLGAKIVNNVISVIGEQYFVCSASRSF